MLSLNNYKRQKNMCVRSFTIITVLLFININLLAQQDVGTSPENRNVILEEFTGVRCSSCPNGHAVAESIMAANPDDVFVIAYHPSNSGFTNPIGDDPDFGRTFPNAFFSTSYAGSSLYMPGAFINRQDFYYSGELQKLQSSGFWSGYSNLVMAFSSPLNVGLNATYNSGSEILTVDVEVYYTSSVSDANTINVVLLENNLQSQQYGVTGLYTHKHTFREALTAQWGDSISSTTATSLNSFTFTFDNSTQNYVMENCEVVAFVYNLTTTEVVSGFGVDVDFISGTNELSNRAVSVYPNPTNGLLNIIAEDLLKIEVYDMYGKKVQITNNTVDLSEYLEGLYLIKVQTTEGSFTKKVIKK